MLTKAEMAVPYRYEVEFVTTLEEAAQYRLEAAEEKKRGNFEFAFLLLDKADSLESVVPEQK